MEQIVIKRGTDWTAQSKNYRDLSNIAQELEGLGAKTKYMLSLK